jgi:uncharacterized protein
MSALRAILPDGRRRHFNHGPIDLVIEAFGAPDEVEAAYEQAWAAFPDILPTLCRELPALRAPVTAAGPALHGPVARRMRAACLPHCATFITAMAAVAGAVADHVLEAMRQGRRLDKAYVNNGGDIALFVSPGHRLNAGVVANVAAPSLDALATLDAASGIGGIATSGWRGRSFSLGIADAATVLARDAAAADAAATLVANAVNVDHAAIRRAPARLLDPDSDLGERRVTVDVGALPESAIETALDRGLAAAEAMRAEGLIAGALLTLAGRHRVCAGAAARSLSAAA